MTIILNDNQSHSHLLPLTYTKPASELRIGILSIREKWEKWIKGSYYWSTEDYLSQKYSPSNDPDALIINASICPNKDLVSAVKNLKKGELLMDGDLFIAQMGNPSNGNFNEEFSKTEVKANYHNIDRPWKIFSLNSEELESDFDMITAGRKSAPLSKTNTIIGNRIFAEEGAKAECSIFNSSTGAIYLGKDSLVMEGSLIRGGLALCEHSQLKLGTKIYGATTVGPHSKVGGEVNNSVITGYSNKGHDGFLGNSVIGEWCNLGADTNNSNLKNNYDEVKLWSYPKGGFEKTGLQFCGLIMADHSKCGINTMFNTGTVVGVSANIFGAGFPRNFIPSFSWGGSGGFTNYNFDKAMKTASLVFARRGLDLDQIEVDILQSVFDLSSSFRQK
tara:strand:- start:806 stop:1975 length:1170 start_codon:yes stop_codon:yes gene_type:complete